MNRVERRRMIGAQTFQPSAPNCPPGFHWEDDDAGPIRGLAACVADRKIVLRIPTAQPPQATVSLPGLTVPTVTITPATPSPPAPPTVLDLTDRAPPPPECPPLWPWWWLVVAAAAGGAAGYYAGKNPKKTKKNAGRVANAIGGRIVNSASSAALSRLMF